MFSSNFWSSEKLIGLAAIVLSLCTLIVFIYQTNLIRKQQYMSVYPHLTLSNQNSGSMNYKYVLRNRGVGPAFITDVEVKKLGNPETQYETLLEYVEGTAFKDSIWVHYSDLYKGQFITANESVILFGLSDDNYVRSRGLPVNTLKGADRLWEIINDDSLLVRITYESIYGESWTLTKNDDLPMKND